MEKDQPTYSSPILITVAGKKQIINSSSGHIFGVNPENGTLLWKQPHVLNERAVALTPSYADGYLFDPCSSRYKSKSGCFKIDGKTGAVTLAWTYETGNPLGSVLLKDGIIISANRHKPANWLCLDAQTGKLLGESKGMAYGSAIYADGHYYCLGGAGKMTLMTINKAGFKEISQFKFFKGGKKKDVWAHPVIANGKLYLRHHDTMTCFDVKK